MTREFLQAVRALRLLPGGKQTLALHAAMFRSDDGLAEMEAGAGQEDATAASDLMTGTADVIDFRGETEGEAMKLPSLMRRP